MVSHLGRYRLTLLSVITAMAVLTSGAFLLIEQLRHPSGGDPGGHILSELRSTLSALPRDATTSGTVGSEPHQDSCDGNPSTRGWDPVYVSTRFATQTSSAVMAANADQVLIVLGWHRTLAQTTPSGDTWRWERLVATGTASFTITNDEHPHLFPATPWDAEAIAPPVGRASSGC